MIVSMEEEVEALRLSKSFSKLALDCSRTSELASAVSHSYIQATF